MDSRDDEPKPRAIRAAGINPHDCPKKADLVDALLRGENPEIKSTDKRRRSKRWGFGRIYDLNMRMWVPQT